MVTPRLSDSPVWNKLRIRPRDPDDADRVVDLTKLTTKDLICWFNRGPRLFEVNSSEIEKYELNMDFDRNRPLGYQWTRVLKVLSGRKWTWTRLVLCMFCQEPTFNPLTGYNCIIRHYMCMHPHEVPLFVQTLIAELALAPIYESRNMKERRPKFLAPLPTDIFKYYKYRQDGFSNKLRFSPRMGVSNTMMKLSEVSENNVLHWFWRDIKDLLKYPHAYARYFEHPLFNPEFPHISQVCRVGHTGDPNEQYHMFMCLFCQRPKFFFMHEIPGLLAHLIACHWGTDIPDVKSVIEWQAQRY